MFCTLVFLVTQLPDVVLADFEGQNYGAWQVKGQAFGNGPAHGTLPNQMVVSGFRGKGLANSFVGGDDTTGSLTSPSFIINRRYLNFLIGGGLQPNRACLNLIVDGKVVMTSTGRSTTAEDKEALAPATWDLTPFAGKSAKVQILDLATGGWGHINIDDLILSDTPATNPTESLTTPQPVLDMPDPEPIYQETYRPQFHFSSREGWLNDPNGLMFYQGQYHLFFQHNPSGIQWGNMTWGHAVSTDLVHWEQRANAIEPDQLGTIYSGSAALDVKNTTGFGTKENPPLVAMYTAAGKPFTQCLAYSTDKGKTWQKYAQNPVLGHIVHENRDPRIFWHQPSNQWIMALYLDNDDFAIYGSPDLKKWKELSRYTLPGSNECPELFEIPIEGTKETKWIFFGANYRYVVGHFDGVKFTPEQEPIRGDWGPNFYASQTYNHTPDGKRIQVAWMNGQGPYPNMPFNQQMSVPCELKLIKTDKGLRMTRTPVAALESLRGPAVTFDQTLDSGALVPLAVDCRQSDIHCEIESTDGARVSFMLGNSTITVDFAKHQIEALDHVIPFFQPTTKLDLRLLLDRSSIEIFGQGGLLSFTSYRPADKDSTLRLQCLNGHAAITNGRGFNLKSAWK